MLWALLILYFFYVASARNHYFVYGRLISMSIVHGGPGPCCFSQLLYDQILGRPINYDLSLLSTSSVYEQLQKVIFLLTVRFNVFVGRLSEGLCNLCHISDIELVSIIMY